MYPAKTVLRYDFPARGAMPPVKIYWYDGLKETPKIPGVPEGEILGDLPRLAPAKDANGKPIPSEPTGYVGQVFNWTEWQRIRAESTPAMMPKPDGSLFVGAKGMITTGTYGENTRLIPVERMADYRFPEPLLTRSPGHYRDWIRAAKGGEPSCSNFSIASPFVEWMLLGVIALRVEGKLEWDAAKMRFTNNADANKYLKPVYRKGWGIGKA